MFPAVVISISVGSLLVWFGYRALKTDALQESSIPLTMERRQMFIEEERHR